jgi:hypothetical protein
MPSPNHVKIGPTVGQSDVGLFGGKLGQLTITSFNHLKPYSNEKFVLG